VRNLPPGALSGHNADLVDVLKAEGLDVPPASREAPAPATGCTVLVDGAGPTARISIGRSARVVLPSWLDFQAGGAATTAEAAVLRLLNAWQSDAFPAVGLAPDEPEPTRAICGTSVGLGVALALISDWLQQPLAVEVCASGVVTQEGKLQPVELLESKARSLGADRPYVTKLLVPGKTSHRWQLAGLELAEVATLEDAARAAGLDLSQPTRVPLAREGLPGAVAATLPLVASRSRDIGWLLPRLEHLWFRVSSETSPGYELDEAAVKLIGPLAEYRTHGGWAECHGPLVAELESRLARRPSLARTHAAEIARAHNAFAAGLIDCGLLARASEHAERAAAFTVDVPTEALRVEGTRGRIDAHALRDDLAVERLRRTVEGQAAEFARESNIPRCYLISSLARLGRLDEARAELEAGRALNSGHAQEGWARDNQRFLLLEEAKLSLAEGDFAKVDLLWRAHAHEVSFWPKLGYLRRFVLARLGQRMVEHAVDDASRAAEIGLAGPAIARWLAAVIAAPVVAELLRRGDSATAELLAGPIRAACASVGSAVDAPYAATARRIASGETSAEAFDALAAGEIY
jgi:hypothetical protein